MRRFIYGVITIIAVGISLHYRHPTFVTARPYEFIGGIILSGILFYYAYRYLKINLVSKLAILLIAVLPGVIILFKESTFQYKKYQFLNADQATRTLIGGHFIVGYHHQNYATTLIKDASVAGIFVSNGHVQSNSIGDIQQELSHYQQLRQQDSELPLLVATDQEGGVVSKLSPPLPYLTSLPKYIAEHQVAPLNETVATYASQQASALTSVGINVNFAPVADVLHHEINYQNDFTKLSKRAISNDPQVVAEVTEIYANTLLEQKIIPTIKHFPGLGRTPADTHTKNAYIAAAVTELQQTDLIPFAKYYHRSDVMLMLSHAIWRDVDSDYPVSFSHKVIHWLRDDLDYQGVLITDDFSMHPVHASDAGIAGATVSSLSAGNDLILISYDPDLFYEAAYGLLQAYHAGNITADDLQQSQPRLKQLLKSIQ